MKRQPTPVDVLDDVLSAAPAAFSRENEIQLVRVPLARIVDNPYQYRQHYDPAGICELATNINALGFQLPETSGLQSPPMGRLMRLDPATGSLAPLTGTAARFALQRDPDVRVQLAFGHRRLRAFQVLANGLAAVFPKASGTVTAPAPSAEYATLPVIIGEIDDQGMAEYALTENSQREQVSALEEATLLQRMMSEFELSLEQAGRKFGWQKSTVSNKLRLLALPEPVRQGLLRGDITEKHARTLLRLADTPVHLVKIYQDCRTNNWSTRMLDEKITGYIRQHFRPVPDTPTQYMGQYGPQPPWPLAWVPAAGEQIKGACTGCALRIHFAGDAGPRCGDGDCFTAKEKTWRVEDEQQQRIAATHTLLNLHGGATLVDILAADGRKPVRVLDKPAGKLGDTITLFRKGSDTGPGLLFEQEDCRADCACFAAVYEDNEWRDASLYQRPDPERAPRVLYCCTDKACMAGKLAYADPMAAANARSAQTAYEAKRLEDPDYAAREARRQAAIAKEQQERAANKAQAMALVDGLVGRYASPYHLFGDVRFMVELAVKLSRTWRTDELRAKLAAMTTVDQVARYIIDEALLQLDGSVYDLAKTQAACNRIAPPPAQPAPGDSQKTNWEAGWDDRDEASYQDVMATWDGNWHHLPSLDAASPRCLLRLIEACSQRDVRGGLHRLHNERKAVAA
jgi:ParB-like chromosome segregation protein Spo0J